MSFALVSLAVGVLTIPFAFFACSGIWILLPLLFVIAGVVLGALGIMREPERSGLALVGLACSLVGLIITIICFACKGC